MDIRIEALRPAGPGDPVLRDLAALYSEEWTGFSPELLWAKYGNNPQAPAGLPPFLAVYADGRLAAANGYIATRFIGGERPLVGVQDCDSYVGRAYRGKGIFSKLIKECERVYAAAGADFIYGYPNENSFGSYRRLDWGIGRAADYRGKAYLGPLGASYRAADRAALRRARAGGWEIVPADPAALPAAAPGAGLVAQDTDGPYLAWRLAPGRGPYRAALARRGAQEGWAAWRVAEGGLKVMALGGDAQGSALALRYAAAGLRGLAQAVEPLDPARAAALGAAGYMPAALMRLMKKRTMTVVWRALAKDLPDLGRILDLSYADFDTV